MIRFTKVSLPYGWLGNMSPHPVYYDNKTWRTVEALFQALRFEDEEIRELIRAEKSPMSAKMVAKKYKDRMVVEPMSVRDVDQMFFCLNIKLLFHPELEAELLKTGSKIIVEDVSARSGDRHLFWGAKIVNGELVGNNTLGNLWMKIREIKTKQ